MASDCHKASTHRSDTVLSKNCVPFWCYWGWVVVHWWRAFWMVLWLSNTVDMGWWFSFFLPICSLCDIVVVVCCLMSATVSLSYVTEASMMAVRCCLLFYVEASFCQLSGFAVCTRCVHRHSLDAQMVAIASVQEFMMQNIACLNSSCNPLLAKC